MQGWREEKGKEGERRGGVWEVGRGRNKYEWEGALGGQAKANIQSHSQAETVFICVTL